MVWCKDWARLESLTFSNKITVAGAWSHPLFFLELNCFEPSTSRHPDIAMQSESRRLHYIRRQGEMSSSFGG